MSGMFREQSLRAFLLVTAAIVSSAPALAQTDTDQQRDVVVVTGTRRATEVVDVPSNISAVAGDDLERQGVTDLSALGRVVPGLSFSDRGIRGNSLSSILIIRGLNVDSLNSSEEVTRESVAPVSIYIDETPLFGNLRLADIERVEVLRGPQGTLYGSGALGGTVRFIQTRPEIGAFDARFTAGLSQTEEAEGVNYSTEGMLNLPVGDQAALRLVGGRDYQHGFIDNVGQARFDTGGVVVPTIAGNQASPPTTYRNEDVNDGQIDFARGLFRYQPNDAWDLQIGWQWQQEEAGARSARAPAAAGFGEYEQSFLVPEPYAREANLYTFIAEGDLGWSNLTSSTSYYETSFSADADFTGLAENAGLLTAFVPINSSVVDRASFVGNDDAFAQELRLASPDGGDWDWLVGAFYMKQDKFLDESDRFVGLSRVTTLPPTGELAFFITRSSEFEDIGLFGQVSWRPVERWEFTTGARAYWQTYKPFQIQSFPLFGFPPSVGGNLDSKEDGVLFMVNGSYEINDDIRTYATFSQGFRRGGANSLADFPLPEPDFFNTYKPDTVNNFEIGLKGFIDRLFFSAAVFYEDWQDAQLAGPISANLFDVVVNLGAAESQGFEFEIGGDLTDDVSARFGYSFTDATVSEGLTRSFTGLFGPTTIGASAGQRLPNVPEHLLMGSLDYTRPVGADMMFRAHLDASYQSEITSDLNNTFEFDGFGLLGGSLGIENDSWRVSLFASNITNEAGVTARRGLGLGLAKSVEAVTRPRTIGVSFSVFN